MSNTDLQERTLEFITAHRLTAPGDRVLVAVSGGPDSVALLHILTRLKNDLRLDQLGVVHFDHQLRGMASEQDRDFVEALAKTLNLRFYLGRKDVRAFQEEQGLSTEMAARICRHHFFKRVLKEAQAQRIAVGHTADDQAEEVLLRLLRGTGPSGTAGMRAATRHGIIRPLLFAARADLMDYLNDVGLQFRQDASNLEPVCQRNLLRLKVFPLLTRHFHPEIRQTLGRHAGLVQAEEDYWSEQIDSLWPQLCDEESSSRLELRLANLLSLHPALLRRVLRFAVERIRGSLFGFYAVHFESLREWLGRTGAGKTFQLPYDIWAGKETEKVIISRGNPFSLQPFRWTVGEPGMYDFGTIKVNFYLRRYAPPGLPKLPQNVAWMDAGKLVWPLVIRPWQQGDRFRPLGLAGTKKLQDFFVDARIPRSKRGQIPLLCDRQGICWIMGLRLDERVRISPQTEEVLVAEFQEGK